MHRARAKVGVEVEISDELVYSTYKSDYRTVGDLDYARIVELYFWGTDGKGMGIGKVGKHPEINRSPSTIRDHLKSHDAAVKRSGFCAVCRRAGGEALRG